ncbi:hypothetical protein GCM10010413_52100 [Promicromonospora sukumoe]|uniref:Uncharacterized protein n=1 Tax=Promicromonospora sukumoe TaxID=88382 RepID=A0A7W3JD52_9MICO|nr:hypothetical protein [Promicromonospora sukumoe]MBA8810655.1 hypothetical protein [Promicromonospora sukumoe]
MAVNVDKGLTTAKTYESGQRVTVDSGHLLVQKLSETNHWVNVAIHAPGEWRRAVVTEAKQP